jgi:hypothetical protein
VVLADAGCGNGMSFRTAITQLGLQYAAGIESSTTVREPGQSPLPAPARNPGRGAPPKRLQRNADHQPVSVKQLALGLPPATWKGHRLAPGQSGNFTFSFRRRPSTSSPSRLQAYGAASGRMAPDRMAKEGIRTHQILAFHIACHDLAEISGEDGQTPLDRRTRLCGTQTGTGIRSL